MIAFERQKKILSLLENQKSLSVQDLCARLYSSAATIRRDLQYLEESGQIKRVRGGAVILSGGHSEIPFLYRESENSDKKRSIAAKALSLIADNQTLFMDSSSTVAFLSRLLTDYRDLTVITNGVKTITSLMDCGISRIYCCGGLIKQPSGTIGGPQAQNTFSQFHSDILFFSCAGMDLEAGITETQEENAWMKREMIKNAKKSVLLCDSSKFGEISFCKIAELSRIDCLVTDKKPDSRWLQALTQMGITVI